MDSFFKSYACAVEAIRVGEEYKIMQLEHDPFYGQMPEQYRTLEVLSGFSWSMARYMFQQLDLFMMYFEGEYKETSDEEFMDIWPVFFKNWYLGHVFVCYSEEMLQVEVESWKNREDLDFDKCRGNCKYRLFRKVKQHTNNVSIYQSLFSGLTYEIDRERVPMVRGSFNEGMAYLWWWDMSREVVSLEQMYKQSQKLAMKRIIREEKDPKKSELEDKSLASINPVFNVNKIEPYNNNNYELFDVMPAEAPKLTLESFLNWFNWKAAQMGYMGDMNEKKERLTTGENFQNMHGITNIQQVFLTRLNQFARAFNLNYNKQLNFDISNWGTAQGVPEDEGNFRKDQSEPKTTKDQEESQ